jgi:hypothetical protein
VSWAATPLSTVAPPMQTVLPEETEVPRTTIRMTTPSIIEAEEAQKPAIPTTSFPDRLPFPPTNWINISAILACTALTLLCQVLNLVEVLARKGAPPTYIPSLLPSRLVLTKPQ